MSSLKNFRFSTRLGPKVEPKVQQQQCPKPMDSHQLINLELNKDGQYVLPFSRRVIDIDLPWLIKQREQHLPTTTNNHGKQLPVQTTLISSTGIETDRVLHLVDRRIGNKYSGDDFYDCPRDIFGQLDYSDPRAWCRLYEDDYYDDDNDDDEYDDDDAKSMAEGQRMWDEYVENFTKSCWARCGKSIPDDFLNPFEIYDD